jgi:hypothetical protein
MVINGFMTQEKPLKDQILREQKKAWNEYLIPFMGITILIIFISYIGYPFFISNNLTMNNKDYNIIYEKLNDALKTCQEKNYMNMLKIVIDGDDNYLFISNYNNPNNLISVINLEPKQIKIIIRKTDDKEAKEIWEIIDNLQKEKSNDPTTIQIFLNKSVDPHNKENQIIIDSRNINQHIDIIKFLNHILDFLKK